MASRKRRYLGCLGLVLALVALLALINFALASYYRHQSALIAREMAAKGYPTTYDDLVARQNARSEDHHNGADDLLAAFTAFSDDGVNFDLLPIMGNFREFPEPGQPFAPEILAELNKLISLNHETLALLRSGVRAEDCRFPMVDVDVLPYPVGQFADVRQAARLLSLQSLYSVETGDMETAIDAIESGLLLGDCYCRQATTTASMVGIAVTGIGRKAGTTALERGKFTNRNLYSKLAEVFEHAGAWDVVYSVWTNVLWSEDCTLKYAAPALDDQAIWAGASTTQALTALAKSYADWYSFLPDRDVFATRSAARLLLDIRGKTTIEAIEIMDRSPLKVEYRLDWLSIYESYVVGAARQSAMLRAMAASARVLAYRAEHGRLPEPSEFAAAITPGRDPFDGEPLRYRKSESGFVVYSVGPNGRDDGGIGWREKKGADDEVVEIRLPK